MDEINDLVEDNSTQKSAQSIAWHHSFARMTSDMKFVGIFHIIYGGLACLTIIGAIIGIPTIIMGLRLREAAEDFNIFKSTNQSTSMKSGFEKQGKYFFIQKVLIIIGLCIFALYIVVLIILLVTGVGLFSSYDYSY